MDEEQRLASSLSAQRLAEKMRDEGYRKQYVEAHTRQFLARQMREFRGDMSQTEFAAVLGKTQTVVSRLEDPSYVGWSLRTLFEIAHKENVAVIVRFVDFATFLRFATDMSDDALQPVSYDRVEIRGLDESHAQPKSISGRCGHDQAWPEAGAATRGMRMTTAREKLGLAELPDPHGTIAYAIERLAKAQEATAGTAHLVREAFRAALVLERRQAIVEAMAFCEASASRWPAEYWGEEADFCVARLQEFLDAQPKETPA